MDVVTARPTELDRYAALARTTGIIGIGQLWDLLYLVVFFIACMWIAMRQMEKKLIK